MGTTPSTAAKGRLKWAGAQDAEWDACVEAYGPFSEKIEGHVVCDECGASVDYLFFRPQATQEEQGEEAREELAKIGDEIAKTPCGRHDLLAWA